MYKTIEKRSPLLVIVFTLITCGLYTIYWYFKMYSELVRITNVTPTRNPFWLDFVFSILTCGLWGFYVDYKISKQFQEIRKKYNLIGDDSSFLILLLDISSLFTFYFLFILTCAIQQDEWNQILEQIATPLGGETIEDKNSKTSNNQNPYF
ncbi:MAG: DUF4234 domain-containing protein [Leptonema sp. (in: bacteria)]